MPTALLFALAAAAPAQPAAPLPRLPIDATGISISGLSSGADFTAQFQVAFSSLLAGSGVFAGQPWRCAITRFPDDEQVPACGSQHDDCTTRYPAPSVPICDGCDPGRTLHYDHCKNHVGWVRPPQLAGLARDAASAGTIDDVSHLKKSRVYLYRGTKDATYDEGSVANVGEVLMALGTPASNILLQNTTPSAHSWPTDDWGTACGKGVIEDCHYDGPGACLTHIYEGSSPPLVRPASPRGWANASLREFDQRPFWSDDNNGTASYNATTPRATGLAPAGFVYVPAACAAQGAKACRLHLSLHGCGVNGYYDDEVHHLGFQAWGEANGIVILFPRMQPHGYAKETQSGCWDAYAQSGADYAAKSGVQMAAVRAMIAAVAGV